MGPLYFDFGFGPFRWVCASGRTEDLAITDKIAAEVLEEILKDAPSQIHGQLKDNIKWIKEAHGNKLVVGSQARILYADARGRMNIALAFNQAIRNKSLGPVVLGRDHHDVSGTDSPYRETSNIYDGSQFTADMAIHNVIGDSFRGATWVSIHNGGGVGWGEALNGGFGMVLDGSPACDDRIVKMLHFDVHNGLARRAWARNKNAVSSVEREMQVSPSFRITLPNAVNDDLLDAAIG
jgi:urocanate hydratase